MRHFVAIALVLCPCVASAVDSIEFHLFGGTAKGGFIDVTPFGPNTSASGEPFTPEGLEGSFYLWLPFGEDNAKPTEAGTCRLSRAQKIGHVFACRSGKGLLAGARFVGAELTARDLDKNSDAQRLYSAWISKREH